MAGALSLHLNPFASRGADLPPAYALTAKLLAAGLVWQGIPFVFTEPFLPFFSLFDAVRPHGVVRPILIALALTGYGLLFFTRRTRAGCLCLGAALLLSMFAAKPLFTNGKTFWSFLLLLLGLYEPEDGHLFMRWQFVVVYLGCALSKALDLDWWSGRYFENWMLNRLEHLPYLFVSAALPELWLARLFSWSVIVMEFAAAYLFARGRRLREAVWLLLFLHTGILFLLWGETFGDFYFAVVIGLLPFLEWPQERMTLTFAAGRAWAARFAAALRWADADRAWRFVARETPGPGLELEFDGRRYRDFAAFKRALLYTPVLLFFLLALALPSRHLRPFPIAAALLLFLPPLEAFWNRIFRRFAGGT